MKRPKLEDFKPEYTKGLTGIVSVAKKFVKAQDLYIDYLEQLILSGVSQQSKLLFRFANDWNNEGLHAEHILESDINRFIEKEPK
mgnify:CR=1 FL=1